MDIYLIITVLGYVFPTLCEVSTTTPGPASCPADIPNGTITTGCSRTVSSYCTYWCDYSWCSKRFTRLYCNQYGFWSDADKACLCKDQNSNRSSTTTSFPTRLSTTTPYLTTAFTTDRGHVFVRLADSAGPWTGRVELYYFGVWGTVCDDRFGADDAFVICKMLGYAVHRYPMVYPNAYFGEGNGTIIIDELECTGSESSIENCDASWFSHDCSHSEDVGIDCLESAYPYLTTTQHTTTTRSYTTRSYTTRSSTTYTHQNSTRSSTTTSFPTRLSTTTPYPTTAYTTDRGQVFVRLADGAGPWQGRVEVYYLGVWGTVCNDRFGVDDAFVICKMLGYAMYRYPMVYLNAYFGEGNGTFIVDELECTGSESSIEYCDASWFSHHCSHRGDAGINCFGESTTTPSSLCPFFIRYGRMDDSCSRRPYSYCKVYCDNGCHSMRTYMYCSPNERWIGEQTACNCSGVTTTTEGYVLCPKYIPNGRMVRCDLRPLSLCPVSCDAGCRPSTSYLRCDLSGRWLGENTACNCSGLNTTPEPSVRCPAFIPNGYIDNYEYCSGSPYSACKYACYFGCSREFSYLRCTWNGTWFNADTACKCRAPLLCPKELDNGHVQDSCSRTDWANCTYDCEDNCDKDPKVNSLLCRNGTWYSARPWTMDTENPCICDSSANESASKKTGAVIAGVLCGATCLIIILITVCIFAVIRKRRRMVSSGGSTTRTAFSQQPLAYSRTEATAPRTAGITASTQRTRIHNGVSSPIYMLSNTVTCQSVQYTASQNSCYLVPEATSGSGSAYPDAPPSYSSIAAAKPEELPPPPSYEEAVLLNTSPTMQS